MFSPRADLVPNTAAYENEALIKATGFREYDARWLFGPEINLLGIQALGLGLGTYVHELGQSKIVVGHDFRSYSTSIKNALILGLLSAGCEVHDIGHTIHPHPTLSESVGMAAEVFDGSITDLYIPKKAKSHA